MNLCDDIITVFNAKYNPATDSDDYNATIITGVSWFCEIVSSVDKGLKAANKFTIRIPETANFGGRTYAAPAEYASTEDASGLFTLHNGDIIVHGAVTETAPRPAALHKKYEAFTVLGVTDNRRARNAPHWKVVGA